MQQESQHGVYMVTGYKEACAVYADTDTFSSCNAVTGPFPGFPVPLEGRDDVSELVEQHRDELPFSDQVTTMDPPKHRDHRHLLMRQLTPKRMKENEEFVWRLADRQIDEFIERGECEFIGDYANPFTLFVIADLLGVPEAEHGEFREALAKRPRESAVGSTKNASMTHTPLEWLYDRFSQYVADRRLEPRADVLTALATTTFPNGELPEVIDVVRVAANVFAAGQETTVRLLGTALQLIGDRADLQQLLRDRPDLIPDFVEETLRIESPVKGDFRLARRPASVGGVDVPAGATRDGAQRRREPGPAPLRGSRRVPGRAPPTRESTSPSGAASTAARADRWRGSRRRSASSACSAARRTSRSPRSTTARSTTAATSTCRRSSSAA